MSADTLFGLSFDEARAAQVAPRVARRPAVTPPLVEPDAAVRWPAPIRPAHEQMRLVTDRHYREVARGVRAVFRGSPAVDAAMVQDAVQDAALVLLRTDTVATNLRRLWTFAAVNKVKDALKSPARRHRLSLSADDVALVNALDAEVTAKHERRADTPAGRLARSEFASIVQEFLSSHPAAMGRTLWLADVEGREHREIAQMMRTTIGASKMRLKRARDAFREFLDTKHPDITTGDLFA